MISTEDVCIICLEDGDNINNICERCNCAFMHNVCFTEMKNNRINKCPTCREKLFNFPDNIEIDDLIIAQTLEPLENNNILTEIDNFINYIVDCLKKIYMKFCKLFICIVVLFLIYIILGFIQSRINGNIIPPILSLRFLLNVVTLLICILIIFTVLFVLLHFMQYCFKKI
jgi:hypothetical protein